MAEKINLTFLGTGSAVPTKRRNHPAVLMQYKDENLLFDCGEGTQRQFRYANLNPCKLTRIFLSHWHGDHVFGIPGILQTLALNNYSGKLCIYGPRGTKQFMELYERLFIKKGSSYQMEIKECNDGTILDEKEFKVDCMQMNHDAPCLAYSFTIKEKSRIDKKKLKKLKLPENSPLIGELARGKTITFNDKRIDGKKLIYTENQKKVTYVMDTQENPQSIDLAKNSDLLICESTYCQEEKEQAEEYKHMTGAQAAQLAKKSKSKKLILMHLSQRYENPKYILEEAKKVFKDVKVAEDLDKVSI